MNPNTDYKNTSIPPATLTNATLEESTLPEIKNGQIIDGTEVIKNDVIDGILKNFPTEGKFVPGLRNSYILELSGYAIDQLYEYMKTTLGEDLKMASVQDLGFHISIIRASVGDPIFDPTEFEGILNTNISFEPHYLCSVPMSPTSEWESLYAVVVKAPALEKIRTDHGMKSRIEVRGKELEFHISIANRPRAVPVVAADAAEAVKEAPANKEKTINDKIKEIANDVTNKIRGLWI